MKIISHNDIMNLDISAKQCFDWVTEAIKNKRNAILPAKISLKPSEGIFYNTMPVILPDEKLAGVKVVNRYPARKPSLDSQILIYGLEDGNIKALIDGNFITTMRTGAVAAHSVKLFAAENFSEIGVMGLGNTARAAIKVLLSIYPERKLKIKLLKYKEQHIMFREIFSEHTNVTFSYSNTPEELVDNSDVVISAATVLNEDVCADKYFKEGCLLIPIHTRGFTNCDLFFDKIYADDRDHVKGFKNFSKFKQFAEVSDVVNRQQEGRINNQERIIAYNIGIALHDIYYAGKIYNLAQERTQIDLQPPVEKFWIK